MNDEVRHDDTRAMPQVIFEFDCRFLESMVRAFGIEGWNRWMGRLVRDWMPLGWTAGEDPPPVWYSFDFGKVDLPQVTLDQLDLRVCCMDSDGEDGEPARPEVRVPVRVVLVVE